MRYLPNSKNSSTISIQLVCAIVFILFTLPYLYFFQADMLAAAQHVLSGGQTSYSPIAGALIITLILLCVQRVVQRIAGLRKHSYALTYFPSMMLLTLLTSITLDGSTMYALGFRAWLMPLLLAVWVVAVLLARGLQGVEPAREPTGLMSRAMWFNMLQLSLFIILSVSMSNTHAVEHYRMKAETYLMKGDYRGALQVGQKSLESDDNLQMIRMYALARTDQLGENLFAYPVAGSSASMLPVEGLSKFMMYPVDSLYKFLGAKPRGAMTTHRYLELLQRRDSFARKPVADYELCGLLIDKQLDQFVSRLQTLYADSDSVIADRLPKHYREALILYTHQRLRPQIVYRNSVMDEDWKNLKDLEKQYTDSTERKGKVEELYRGTYWYYYEYE